MIGRLTTGSIGLGWLAVMGRSRVPSPPAITTAFMGDLPSRLSSAPLGRGSWPAVSLARQFLAGRPLARRLLARRSRARGAGRRAGGDQPPGLHDVQEGGAPVQCTSPDGEGPTGHPRRLGVTG